MGIKAEDTEQNAAIHAAFREMAKVECRNDYTFALGKLLEYYQADAKTQMLWDELQNVRAEVADLKKKLETKKEQKEEEVAF